MRYDFTDSPKGRIVIYTECVNADAYQSLHYVGNQSDAQAKMAFHREHKREVLELIHQNKTRNENNSRSIIHSSQ